MGILSFLGLRRPAVSADELYSAIVNQARQPRFYVDYGAPDTVAGRFDMITLHAYIVMRRLNELGPEGGAVSQNLFDTMFLDMDRNMREMGVGDIVVGKRIKALAISFYGRIKAYDEALENSSDELTDALRRNLYLEGTPNDQQLADMSNYLKLNISQSEGWSVEALIAGRFEFTEDH